MVKHSYMYLAWIILARLLKLYHFVTLTFDLTTCLMHHQNVGNDDLLFMPLTWGIYCSDHLFIKNSMSVTKFMFFRNISLQRWRPWPLIGRNIYFLSFAKILLFGWSTNEDCCHGLSLVETFSTSLKSLKQNFTKLDRKDVLNVLSQVCFF